MKLLVALFVFLFSLTSLAAPLPASLEEQLAQFISKTETVPQTGVAVGVVYRGKVILARGFGYASREEKRLVTAETLFGIGSCSKAFTSLAMSMLQEDGVLDLSQPIQKYLPQFKLVDPVASAQINTLDLLSHHSGLPRHDLVWYATPFGRTELVRRMAFLEPNPKVGFGFRGKFQYNNLMYITAGTLLEHLSRLSWEQFVTARILQPLEMKATNLSVTEMAKASDYAIPYLGERKLNLMKIDPAGPAGSINSNVKDMLKWVSLHLNQGKVGKEGKALLSERGMNLMYEKHTTIDAPNRDVGYGLGWFFDRTGGQNILFHAGNIDGYSAMTSFYPEKELGMVILSNQDNTRLPMLVMKKVYEIVLSEAAMAKQSFPMEADFSPRVGSALIGLSAASEGEAPLVDLSELVGVYEDSGYGQMVLKNENGKFVLNYYALGGEVNAMSESLMLWNLRLGSFEGELKVSISREEGRLVGLKMILEDDAPPILFVRK